MYMSVSARSPCEKMVSPAPKLSSSVATPLKSKEILGRPSILKLVRRLGFRLCPAIFSASWTDRDIRGFAISSLISSKLASWNSPCSAFMSLRCFLFICCLPCSGRRGSAVVVPRCKAIWPGLRFLDRHGAILQELGEPFAIYFQASVVADQALLFEIVHEFTYPWAGGTNHLCQG